MKRTLFLMLALSSSPVFADPVGSLRAGGYDGMIMIALFIGVFYFMMIRPQQKRAKEHKNLLEGVSKGDEILTTGGLLAKVIKVSDTFLMISVSRDVEMMIQKQAIRSVLPKGTMKSVLSEK